MLCLNELQAVPRMNVLTVAFPIFIKLDMAFGLTETSRLGCQITVIDEMEGVVLEMPKATRNFYVDGHKPKIG